MAMTDGFVRRGLGLVGSALPRRARPPRILRPGADLPPPLASFPGAAVSAEGIAQSIGGPLGHLAGAADLLLDTPLGPLQQSYVRSILGWADEIRTGVDRMLGRTGTQPAETIDLAELVAAAAKLIAVPAREKGVRLVATIESDVPQFSADLPALRQLLVRLCAEALQRTRCGEVSLRALRVAGGVRIVIMDGSSDGTADILDPVVAALAARLDAEIERSHDGSGCSVSVTIPLREAGPPDAAVIRHEGAPGSVDALLERLSRELLAAPDRHGLRDNPGASPAAAPSQAIVT